MSEQTVANTGINKWMGKLAKQGGLNQVAPSTSKALEVELDLLDPNPKQPRRDMDDDELTGLAESIRQHGLIQPITVSKQADGRYIIVAGHRRTEAMKKLRASAPETEKERWSRIPASDFGSGVMDTLAELAITENIQRADLHPIETAEAFANLKEERGWSPEELSTKLGVDFSKTKRYLQLASATPTIKQALNQGLMVEVEPTEENGKPRKEHRRLEFNHALLVLRAHGHWQRTKPKKAADLTRALAERVLVEGWPHRKLKEFVAGLSGKQEGSEVQKSEAEGQGAPSKAALFQADHSKVLIRRSLITESTQEDRKALASLLRELLTELQ